MKPKSPFRSEPKLRFKEANRHLRPGVRTVESSRSVISSVTYSTSSIFCGVSSFLSRVRTSSVLPLPVDALYAAREICSQMTLSRSLDSRSSTVSVPLIRARLLMTLPRYSRCFSGASAMVMLAMSSSVGSPLLDLYQESILRRTGRISSEISLSLT